MRPSRAGRGALGGGLATLWWGRAWACVRTEWACGGWRCADPRPSGGVGGGARCPPLRRHEPWGWETRGLLTAAAPQAGAALMPFPPGSRLREPGECALPLGKSGNADFPSDHGGFPGISSRYRGGFSRVGAGVGRCLAGPSGVPFVRPPRWPCDLSHEMRNQFLSLWGCFTHPGLFSFPDFTFLWKW